MKIYVRNDINMRKGKVCAQVSHACMALWLDAMEKNNFEYVMDGDNLNLFNNWKESGYPIELIKVSLEELKEKINNESVVITDAGRTEFKEPTITCMAQLKGIKFKERKYESKEEKPAKQVLIANRDKNLNKYELAPLAAIQSWLVLENLMIATDTRLTLNLNEALYYWLNHGFAKITLKADSDLFEEMSNKLKENHLQIAKNEDVILAIEPKMIEDIDKFTSHLKLY